MDHAERPVTSEDPAELALATVDQAFPDESDAERRTLRSALEAAAVPHWCDAAVLIALVDDSGLLGQNLWDHLRTLPVIEGFPARPGAVGYVAEISRLGIRKRLAETQRAMFIDLNRRLVRLLPADTLAAGRIERIYHLLVADAEQGVAELAKLNRRWTAEARQEDLEALDWQREVSLAYSHLGAVAYERGDPDAAERAFAQDLAISQRLARLDPDDTDRQEGLATTWNQVGDVAQELGDPRAEHGFNRYEAAFERLTRMDPDNANWRWELAEACRTGG